MNQPRLYSRMEIPGRYFEIQAEISALNRELLDVAKLIRFSDVPHTDDLDLARMEGEGGVPC